MDKFFTPLKSEHLKADEKDFGRLSMTHAMAFQPILPKYNHSRWYKQIITLVVVGSIFVAGAGSVAVAAAGTIPGDQLHPVKLVIESVISDLTISPTAKARWETRRLEWRLEEAEDVLHNKSNYQGTVTDSVDQQAHRVEHQVSELHRLGLDDAAAEVSGDVTASLQAHEDVLLNGMAVTNDDHGNLLRSVQAHQEKAAAGANTDKPTVVPPQAVAGKAKAAKQKITEVQQYIQKWTGRLSADVTAKVTSQLAVAQATYDDGQAKFTASDNAAAFHLFQQALRQAQSAKIFLSAHQRWQKDDAEKGNAHEPSGKSNDSEKSGRGSGQSNH